MKSLIRFFRDEKAATSIEYSLIATGIALAILVAVNGVGTSLNAMYESVRVALN
ncbi:MAG: Flp family type IVb pilin [Pseudomonadota bacterium]